MSSAPPDPGSPSATFYKSWAGQSAALDPTSTFYKALSGELIWSTEFTESDFAEMTRGYQRDSRAEGLEAPEPPPPRRGPALMQITSLMYDSRPADVARYVRLFSRNMMAGVGLEEPIQYGPILTGLWAHYYFTIAYQDGFTPDVLIWREQGARKEEMAHLMALAWFHGGNHGGNFLGRAADAYMRAWDAEDGAPGLKWPEDWSVDPDVFRCGVDFTENTIELSQTDIELIENWHLRWHGEVPAYVRFFARHHPTALRAFRARYETAMEGALPSQMVALLSVHLSAARMLPDSVRRSVHMAKQLGIKKDHVAQTLAFTQLPLGDTGLDYAVVGAESVFDAWEIVQACNVHAATGL